MLALATPSRELAIGLRHECGGLLVTGEDKLDGRLFQGHEEVGVFFPGQAEDILDPLGFEALDEQFSRVHECENSMIVRASRGIAGEAWIWGQCTPESGRFQVGPMKHYIRGKEYPLRGAWKRAA
jgi:hypothetical protein